MWHLIDRLQLSVAKSGICHFAINSAIVALRLILITVRGSVRIKMINLILPHVQEDTGRQIIDRLPNALDFRKCIFPDRSLAPLLALLFALVGGAH